MIAGGVVFAMRSSLTPAQIAFAREQARIHAMYVAETAAVKRSNRLVNVSLPSRESQPAPATPASLFVQPLSSHQVVGFVPYWALGGLSAADFVNSTVMIYSAVCVGEHGTIITSSGECANALNDLGSPSFLTFMQSAHAAHDRVLLSVQTVDEKIIHALVTHVSKTTSTLSTALSQLVSAYGFDGIDLDIEGRGSGDREGYVHFVQAFTNDVRAGSAKLELTLDSYPQSAAGSTDFYDVARLSRYVDYLLVMAYQEENGTHSSANSPLASPTLGWSAVQALLQYTKVVPRDKIILLLPFYGLHFATKTDKPESLLAADSLGEPLYADILAADRPAQWDVASSTPYSSFKQNGKWQQDWYDDPVSIALKTALAENFHIAGVGVWALSMEGSDPQMLNALTGDTPPVKLPLPG